MFPAAFATAVRDSKKLIKKSVLTVATSRFKMLSEKIRNPRIHVNLADNPEYVRTSVGNNVMWWLQPVLSTGELA